MTNLWFRVAEFQSIISSPELLSSSFDSIFVSLDSITCASLLQTLFRKGTAIVQQSIGVIDKHAIVANIFDCSGHPYFQHRLSYVTWKVDVHCARTTKLLIVEMKRLPSLLYVN